MELYIVEKKGLYFIVSNFGRTIYTYMVCDSKEKAESNLKDIEKLYGE